MGRFFGYRKGYEMLPRIWLTKVTEEKFRFMATLEEELREDIETYILEGMDANEYGPKIKNSPKLTWLRITAKNQNAKCRGNRFRLLWVHQIKLFYLMMMPLFKDKILR